MALNIFSTERQLMSKSSSASCGDAPQGPFANWRGGTTWRIRHTEETRSVYEVGSEHFLYRAPVNEQKELHDSADWALGKKQEAAAPDQGIENML